MKFKNVVISSFAYDLPEQVMTSEEIEERLAPVYQRLKLPGGRIELMTGIKERRFWPPGTMPSDLSTQAARNLFAKNIVKPEHIDLLIHASVCRDFLEPSTSSIVHYNLGLRPQALIFDLSNACLGMMSSFVVAANMIENGSIKHALIVSGENGGPLLFQTIDHLLKENSLTRKSIKKYIANLTIGAAAVAYTISHKDYVQDGHLLMGGASLADSSANVLCRGGGDTASLMMETDSEELMKSGIALAQTTWEEAKRELEWTNDDVDCFVGHQVGVAHDTLLKQTLKLVNCPTFTTYPYLGNTGASALPVTLNIFDEQKKIPQGSKVGLLGIGSGLNSIMLGVKW
ncbi:MAG: 3-oxoacyl-ACP synthase III [Deltaproteobacteria bacterium HGW-Deltaproteobacteria-13]|jgi:3-oxoacyl-[acyl-carrier-protein] synthase-3|nr:MAG: 3-oxoacyl-ACP synthase III [Deltaproteobacteria bacterium HGW-Deltaproteobacteria-13]